jgi:Protein of unknown function (DUF2490)
LTISLQRLLPTVIVVAISVSSFGQDKYIVQGAFWLRYYNQTKLSDKLTSHLELDERILFNPVRQQQFFAHVHVHYQLKPWLDVAVGGNYNSSHSMRFPSLAVPEFRPWQEISITKAINTNSQFQVRYRLDERFIHNNAGGELTDGFSFNLRHRFRVQILYEIKKISDSKSLVIRVSDEVMLNTGNVSDTFDQNRIYTSIEYRFSKSWSVETGYLNQLQSRSTDDGFYDRHIVRVTVYHRLHWRKVK